MASGGAKLRLSLHFTSLAATRHCDIYYVDKADKILTANKNQIFSLGIKITNLKVERNGQDEFIDELVLQKLVLLEAGPAAHDPRYASLAKRGIGHHAEGGKLTIL